MATGKSFRPAMAYLTLDILTDHIFIKLPVRSLLRCRCVCKQWHQLLTEPYFIMMHIKHQKIHNHQKILCGPIWYKEELPGDSKEDYQQKKRAFYGVFYSVDLQLSSSSAIADAVRLPGFPLLLKNYLVLTMLGYCNGMVYMEVSNYLEKEYSKSRRLLIGNPSTGDYKILPEPTPVPPLIGFGYDSFLDDYKCVMVDNLTRNPHIFSLKLNSWRTNLGSSDNFAIKGGRHYQNVGIALDRSIYWLVESSNIIVEFDLKDEEFRELLLPHDRPRDVPRTRLSMKLVGGGGGSLCIINVCFENNMVDMWSLLKEEENNNKNNKEKCCWSKLMTVTLSDYGFFEIHPLCFMKDGKVLCCVQHGQEEVSFVLIDPKTKRLEDFTIRDEIGDVSFMQFTFGEPHMGYLDSLVSPN